MIYIYTGLNIHNASLIRVKCTDQNVWKIQDGNIFIPMKSMSSPIIDGGVHPRIAVGRMASILTHYKVDDIVVISCCNPDIINFMGEAISLKLFPREQLKIVLLNEDSTDVLYSGSMSEDGYLGDGWPYGFFNYDYKEAMKCNM